MCHTDDLLKSLNDHHLCNYLFYLGHCELLQTLSKLGNIIWCQTNMWAMLLKNVTLRNFKIKEDVIFNLFEFKPEMFQNI